MKLYYYQGNNFGDELNPLIWNSLAPELFDEDESTLLVGIGTLINSSVPALPKKIVFGSGAGYVSPAAIDDKWKFYCVRGPLTAELLGLDKSLAITDPAVLLRQLFTGAVPGTGQICFMPHHVSLAYADWRDVCTKAGITYLDPAEDTLSIISKIRGAKLVIAEAMHAAIVADAFRVPWIPVQCYDHILGFKWNDWCQSMDLPYQPQTLPSLWDIDRTLSPQDRFKSKLKRGLRGIGIWADNWTPPSPATNLSKVEDTVIAALSKLATDGRSYLSEETRQQAALDRLLERMEVMKRDYAKVEY